MKKTYRMLIRAGKSTVKKVTLQAVHGTLANLMLIVVALCVFAGVANAGKSIPVPSFFNGLGSHSEIKDAGGKVYLNANFAVGLEGDALTLLGDSYVSFVAFIDDEGMITFWIKPHFDIESAPMYSSVGLFETKGFSGPNSFGLWVYNSEWGPVVIFEAKDSNGEYVQAWSKVTSFEPDMWHQIAFQWNCNQDKLKKNWGRVIVDKKKGKKEKGFCQDIDLGSMEIRFGDNNFWLYSGDTATYENLTVYGGSKIPNSLIKSDWKKYKDLR